MTAFEVEQWRCEEDIRERYMCVIGKSVCVCVHVSDLSLDTWVNSPGHLERLIDFSCDHRSFRDGMHATTHPEEQTRVFVDSKCVDGDT